MPDKAMRIAGAGELIHRATVQRRSTSGTGVEPTVIYTADTSARWCSIEPLRVSELLIKEDSEVFSEATHYIKMRPWSNPPQRKDCIVFGSATWNTTTGKWSGTDRIFELLGEPRNIEERGRQLEMICVERIGG